MITPKAQRAIDRIAALSASIREIVQRQDAKRMGVSFVTRRAMESGDTGITSARPYTKLRPSTRRAFKRFGEKRRPRPQKSTEKIFHLPANSQPDWYSDKNAALPARLVELLHSTEL